ncbi:MAG: hypothetical protein DBX47_07520 [Clostridiales bacterium]|nr:MAG: hypothetical protein DBX47_07520 [Clostridiales bacterium]
MWLLLFILVSGCSKTKELGDNEKNALPATSNSIDGESQIFQSVFSSGVFFTANYFPRQNGAVGDGVADDTAAIQAAIDKAASGGGGVVYLDRGTYRVTSPITIKNNVKLIGDFNAPSAKRAAYSETVVVFDGDFTTTSPFTLEDRATISDMVVYNKNQNADDPIRLAPTITQNGARSVCVENMLLLNSSTGIVFSSEELESVYLKNIYITAFYSALSINGSNAVVSAENINISPSYFVSNTLTNPEYKIKYDDKTDFFKSNINAVNANVKGLSMRSSTVDAVHTAFTLSGGSGRLEMTNVTVTNALNCINMINAFAGGSFFCGSTFSPVFGTDNNAIHFSENFTGSAVFTGCVFSGKAGSSVKINGDASVEFNGCTFASWKNYGVEITDGIASFSGCKITPDSDFARLDDNAVGVFYSNAYFSNLKTSGGQVFSTSSALSYTIKNVAKTMQTPGGIYNSPKRTQIYKVLGTSETDIQKTIDEAYANGGGIVYVKEGSYTLSKTVIIRENVWLCGAGAGENALSTSFYALSSFEGSSVFELKTNAAVCNAYIEDNSSVELESLTIFEKTAIYSESNNAMASGLNIEGFSYGVAFIGSSSAIVKDVKCSSFKSGFLFEKNNILNINNCVYKKNNKQSQTDYQNESGVGFTLENCISPELFNISAQAGEVGVSINKTEALKNDTEDIGLLINGFSSWGVKTSIRLEKNKLAYIINSDLSSSGKDVEALLDDSGTVALFNSRFTNTVNVNGGSFETTGCIFAQADIPLNVSDGMVRVTASVFENKEASAHLYATGGAVVFDANIIITKDLYNGSSTGYIKSNLEGEAVAYDNFNLKRVDYENVD